jgi:hypothetical protein
MSNEDTTRRMRALQFEQEPLRAVLARFRWNAPLATAPQGAPMPSQSAKG